MNTNWQESDLQTLLYRKYILERETGTLEIKEIARRLKDTPFGEQFGYSSSLVYKYIEGEKTPPPEFFPAFYNATRDIDVINWFIKQCRGLVLYNIGDVRTNGETRDETDELTILSGRFIEEVNEDNNPDRLQDIASAMHKVSGRLVQETKEMKL